MDDDQCSILYHTNCRQNIMHKKLGHSMANAGFQCWTEGRRSTAVAEDLRPTATATVAEV